MKICKWLNKNEMSGIQIRDDGNIYPCVAKWINLVEDKQKYCDYNNLSLEDFQKLRQEFLNKINNGEVPECDCCDLLHETYDETAGIGAIKHLVYHPHTLCTLNCCYCFYTDEQRSIPIPKKYQDLYKTIKHFYDIGFLDKENFALDLGGGEPLLLKNIDKTLEFMSKTWQYSIFYLLSNSTIVSKANELIETVKQGKFANVSKQLITSLDCGTRETYELIRKKDLFFEVCNNLYNYAKNSTFDRILLKYILLDDFSNGSDEDIFGFLKLCKLVADNQEKEFAISIDVDWLKRKNTNDRIPDRLLMVAGKMYYIINEIMKVDFLFASDYLSPETTDGKEAIDKILRFAEEYGASEKSFAEQYELNRLRKIAEDCQKCCDEPCQECNTPQPTPTLLQQVFSVRNEDNHKVLRIFGIKGKFKRRAK